LIGQWKKITEQNKDANLKFEKWRDYVNNRKSDRLASNVWKILRETEIEIKKKKVSCKA